MLNERQFAAIYTKHSDEIWRFCAVRTNDPDLAEDLTQLTFTRAWESEAFAKPGTKHRAFLFQVARNLLSVKEAADVLGVTEGNVRQMQFRALKTLRSKVRTKDAHPKRKNS